MFPLLCFCHGSPPYWSSNEPGVQRCNLSSGIIATQKAIARHQCYGARAWDQTRERARRSKHQWGYDLHLPLPCSIINTRTALPWSIPVPHGYAAGTSAGHTREGESRRRRQGVAHTELMCKASLEVARAGIARSSDPLPRPFQAVILANLSATLSAGLEETFTA